MHAYEWYPAWDGSEMVIKAGRYPETGVFRERMRWKAKAGTVVIGE
jgi:hypothetical protein